MIHAYKWSLAALLVLPQSVLLGMTFPLISGGIMRRWPERPGETLSALYFTNSLGVPVGILVSGFVLIGIVGLPGTTLTAGLLNVVVALESGRHSPTNRAKCHTVLHHADTGTRWRGGLSSRHS